MPDGVGSPERGRTRKHLVGLVLSDWEWDHAIEDARECGITVDQMLSLVVAFATRARINSASCLALHDICRPYSEQIAESGR